MTYGPKACKIHYRTRNKNEKSRFRVIIDLGFTSDQQNSEGETTMENRVPHICICNLFASHSCHLHLHYHLLSFAISFSRFLLKNAVFPNVFPILLRFFLILHLHLRIFAPICANVQCKCKWSLSHHFTLLFHPRKIHTKTGLFIPSYVNITILVY